MEIVPEPDVQKSGPARARSVAVAEPDRNPPPLVTYALIALLVGIFAAMYAAGRGDVNIVAQEFGDKESGLVLRGHEWWRLITAVFLHGSVAHIAVNAASLYWIGSQMEWIYGARRYLILFVLSGIAGNIASTLFSTAPSLGASGAIFGLVGAGLVFPLRFRDLVPYKARAQIISQLAVVTVVNLALGWLEKSWHVDNAAHIGGLIGGGLVALTLVPAALLDGSPRPAWRETGLSLALSATTGLVLVAGLLQWHWAQLNGLTWVRVGPERGKPVWMLAVPRRWKRQGAQWRTPSGSTFEVVDSADDPEIQRETALFSHLRHPDRWVGNLAAWTLPPVLTGPSRTIVLVGYAPSASTAVALLCRRASCIGDFRDYGAALDSMRYIGPAQHWPQEKRPA